MVPSQPQKRLWVWNLLQEAAPGRCCLLGSSSVAVVDSLPGTKTFGQIVLDCAEAEHQVIQQSAEGVVSDHTRLHRSRARTRGPGDSPALSAHQTAPEQSTQKMPHKIVRRKLPVG